MTWTPLGRGSDNNFYYRNGDQWFSNPTELQDLSGSGSAPGINDEATAVAGAHPDAVHTGTMPESSWPSVEGWTRNYNSTDGSCAYTRPGASGGPEIRRTFPPGNQAGVRADLATNSGVPPAAPGPAPVNEMPVYAPPGGFSAPQWFMSSPAASRLTAAGIDPAAYFSATRGDQYGTAGTGRTNYLNGIGNTPAGSSGDADLRNRMATGTADRYLDYYRSQGVEVSVAYNNLRSRGILAEGAATPPDWGHQTALGPDDVPHTGSGASSVSTVTPQACNGNLAELESMRGAGLGANPAARTDRVREDTARLNLTNGWVDRMAAQPGWTRESARAVLRNMDPPLLGTNGRITSFDTNAAAHRLYDVPADTRVDGTHDLPPGSALRTPTMGGIALRPDQPTPPPTPGVTLSPLAAGFVRARPPTGPAGVAPGGSPGAPVGSPTGTGGFVVGSPAAPGGSATIVGPNGQPITLPPGVAVSPEFLADLNAGYGMALATQGAAGAAPGSPGATGSRFVSTGSATGSPPAYSGEGPVTSDITPAASGTPEATALSAEADRMAAVGFSPAEISEYQRQSRNRLGRERSADEIGHSFTADGGGAIPADQRAGVLTSTRAGMRTYLVQEGADGIRRMDPSISNEDALLMSEQMYRERSGTGSTGTSGVSPDATLDQMLTHRSEVGADLRYAGMAGHPERMTALRERTNTHEENAFYEAARASVPAGDRAFYGNTPEGRRNLRLYMVSRGGDGIFNSPSGMRRLRLNAEGTGPDSGLGTSLHNFKSGEGATGSASRGALEGRLSTAGGGSSERPDFASIPGLTGAARAQAEVNWLQTQNSQAHDDAVRLRDHTWNLERYGMEVRDRRQDTAVTQAFQYAMDRQHNRDQRELAREQNLNQLTNQFANQGMQLMQSQIQQMNQLTLQQLQAMNQITQGLIQQGTPKPFDIVMGMLQGGRR
ncbi:MAG: hypothetical protein K8R69_05190 [Deltaproteobacteria bacterium]|nr:hypothetical protein [Deltaproteobacteria bacterium]